MRALDPPPEVAADFALPLEAFGLVSESVDGDAGARAEFDAADENLEPSMRDLCGLDFGD